MRIGILGGLGREGKATDKFVRKKFPRAKIEILDCQLSKNYLKNLERFDIVFRAPGVPSNLPEIQKAIKKGVKFSSATALFFENKKGIVVGITGTKGKGTTSALLYQILKKAGKDVYLAGNIGKPAIEILSKLSSKSISILELSSFQLQNLGYSPEIVGVLGIFPDHLDYHKNFQEYFEAKSEIAKNQKASDKIFYISNDKWARKIALKSKAKRYPVSENNFKLFKPEDLKIPGPHHFNNAIMAASIAKALGVPSNVHGDALLGVPSNVHGDALLGVLDSTIKKVVKSYRGLEFRLQLVGVRKRIKIYNDSASTNPQATAAAVRAFRERKIIISGGKDKNLNYSPLAKALKNSNTELIILMGENRRKIAKAVEKSGVKIEFVINLGKAVQLACKEAVALRNKNLNSTIIFSPGAASFDMFKNFKDRGERFNRMVKNLK